MRMRLAPCPGSGDSPFGAWWSCFWTGARCSCWERCCPDFDVDGACRGVRDGGHRRRAQRARLAHPEPPRPAAQRPHPGRRGARAQRRARGARGGDQPRAPASTAGSRASWSPSGMTVITTAASALLAIDDDETWQRNVVRRQARRAGAIASDVPGRGVPGDRRPRPRGPAARAARRQRAGHGALAARGHPPAGALGDRLVVADRRVPGGPAARRQRRHAGLPLVGEGSRPRDRDQPPARRAGARAPPLRRPRAAARGRRQPREHPLGRCRRTRC